MGIPGDEDYTNALFGRVAHIVEGFSGVEYCNVDNETEDCIIIKDTACGEIGSEPEGLGIHQGKTRGVIRNHL